MDYATRFSYVNRMYVCACVFLSNSDYGRGVTGGTEYNYSRDR